ARWCGTGREAAAPQTLPRSGAARCSRTLLRTPSRSGTREGCRAADSGISRNGSGGGGGAMMRLSEAARAVGGKLHGEDREFDAVRSDTRELPPRALFVALKGERFDGHDFLDRAAAAGAAAALVQDSGIGGSAAG